MSTIKSAELRPIDSKSFFDFENYISEISDEDQALIVGGSPYLGKGVTVKRGDSLWKLADRYCGSGRDWRQIYNANKDKISNPNLIKPGQRLFVPCAITYD